MKLNPQAKPIKGYEGRYEITPQGVVYSPLRLDSIGRRRQIKILNWYLSDDKYMSVNLEKDGVSVRKYIHRLVAEAFIPNPTNLPIIQHLNSLRLDCRKQNLKWKDYD